MSKNIKEKIYAVIAAAILTTGVFSTTALADWETRNGKTYYAESDGSYVKGWTEIDGETYYFKSNGAMVTKSCDINGIRYKFSSDGVCQGKYTGWTKSSKGRRYYKNGVMLKERWIKTKSGKYYAGQDGYMRTGWARVDGKTCFFDEKGIWDEKKYCKGYKPESMKYFLMDFDFSDDIEYEYCINYNKYYDFEGIDVCSRDT